MKLKISFALLIALLTATSIAPSHASETDSFTTRYVSVADGFPPVNHEVNERITRAVSQANRVSSCNFLVLETLLGAELLRPFYGRIEQFANTSDLVPKSHTFFTESIYQNVPRINYLLLQIGESILGFGTMIHDDKLLIGTDKFGHFFDEGHWFYRDLNTTASNLEQVLVKSELSEEGANGLTFGGIKSYADLIANYQGMHFWSEILQEKLPQGKRYLKCEKQQWHQIRIFDFRDYLDAGWDEAINCNEYISREYEHAVLSTIAALESKQGRKLHCPIRPDECVFLAHKYGPLAPRLLGPKCLVNRL
ncbi:hypothetical protein WDW86_22470 [Bdellovibrionota bacterium FG-2]